LLDERYKQPGTGNQERWDRYVVFGLPIGFILWFFIMPLDAKRFGWSPVSPLWLKFCGGTLLAGSFFLFFRSFADNLFFSSLIRIHLSGFTYQDSLIRIHLSGFRRNGNSGWFRRAYMGW